MDSLEKPSQLTLLTKAWEGITIDYGRLDAVGEFDITMPKQAISVTFAPHDRVTWSFDGSSPKTTNLPVGSVFLYGDREFIWHQRERQSEYLNFHLEPTWLNTIATESGLPNTQINPHVMFHDPTILHVAQLLRTEIQTGGMVGNLYVESLRNLLGIHLLRNYSDLTQPAKPESAHISGLQIQQIKDYIEDHLADELSIADLAALIPMSQFHFARAFKAAIGEPPHRYITQRRLEQAKVLLGVTQLSVAEIAYRVGFSNQSHFTAQFRKTIGATPKQYRDSLRPTRVARQG
jgi:AraC family transcriptional regulator